MKLSAKWVFVRLLMAAACVALLAIVIFAVWRIRLANDIDRQLAAIRAAGLPTNGDEANAYYPAVPDEENAAVKIAAAFAAMTNFSDRRSNKVAAIRSPTRKAALSAEQADLLEEYCAMNSDALARAREAIKLPHSRYSVDLSWGAAAPLPHLAELKRLSRIAEYQSCLNPKSSALAISTIIGLARTLDTEPLLISKLVRLAMLRIAESSVEQRLNIGSIDETDLNCLEQLFAEEASKTNQMANGLIGERAMYLRYFRMSMAEIDKLAKDAEDSPDRVGPPVRGSQPLFFKLTGFFERDLRFYLQSMQTNISLASTFPKNMVMITNINWQISHTSLHRYYLLSAMLLPGLGNANAKDANCLAQVRSAQTALAVERYRLAEGKLPENLSELVPQFLSAVPEDPFDGKPLRYHRLEKGYVIYSVGGDGEDNGGRERPADAKSSDKTPYDITFTVER